MRLLASTDFAMRVLIRLAGTPNQVVTVEQLARELGDLSRHHLHKVVQELTGLGLVRTIRGPRGGVGLAVNPAEVRIGGLIRDLEADHPMVECLRADGGCCALDVGCRLRTMLETAWHSFVAALDGYTLADCVASGAPRPKVSAFTSGPTPPAAR